MPHLEVDIDAEGRGVVRLDGTDISSNLRRIEIEVTAGGYTYVKLHYSKVRIVGSFDVEPTDILGIGRLVQEEPEDGGMGSGGYG
jgi:hypothetical protein